MNTDSEEKDLDCGGKAQWRHRFSCAYRIPKAAWRCAPRRSPRTVVAAQAALGLSVCICGCIELLRIRAFEMADEVVALS
jgi:hypothetical protein